MFAASIATFAAATVGYAVGIRFNLSGSIPPGFYRIVDEPIVRGTVVLVCLPSAISAFARDRRYVPSGSCPDGSSPLGKIVAAMAGDTVAVNAGGIAVNHQRIANSQPLGFDAEGRPLKAFTAGWYPVSASELWLVSSYSPRSFDSRYFGPVDASSVVSRVRPILTWR